MPNSALNVSFIHITIRIPLGVVGMIIIALFLHLPVEEQDLQNKLKRIDYAGTACYTSSFSLLNESFYIGILLVMGATVLFMLAMSFISQGYPWESPLIVVSVNKDVIVNGRFDSCNIGSDGICHGSCCFVDPCRDQSCH